MLVLSWLTDGGIFAAARLGRILSSFYLSCLISISRAVIELPEGIQTGLDTVRSAAVLAWSFAGSLADIAVDLITGRELPQPDLKSVATAPEPGAICKIRPPVAIPRAKRSKMGRDEAA